MLKEWKDLVFGNNSVVNRKPVQTSFHSVKKLIIAFQMGSSAFPKEIVLNTRIKFHAILLV